MAYMLYQHAKITPISYMYILAEGVPMCQFMYKWTNLNCVASHFRHLNKAPKTKSTVWMALWVSLYASKVCGPYIHVATFQVGWMKAHWDIWRWNLRFFLRKGQKISARFRIFGYNLPEKTADISLRLWSHSFARERKTTRKIIFFCQRTTSFHFALLDQCHRHRRHQ